MRVAVLSDVHANRHALEAVLDAAADCDITDLWCLGDVVGYGADPDACVELTRASAAVCLAGNHDLAVTGQIKTDTFSTSAALSTSWTQEVMDPDNVAFLAGLASAGSVGRELGLYHGSPRDPVWEYVLSPLLAELCFDVARERIGFVGHSHIALSFWRHEGDAATGIRQRADETQDLSRGEWLLNPGAVGQPRDGDPRAAWLLLDTGEQTATWKRTPYDVAGAAAAIRAARLPASLAERLEYGQ